MTRRALLATVVLVGLLAATFAVTRAAAGGGGPVAPAAEVAAAAPAATPAAAEPRPRSGRALFGHTCGSCHTLRAAEATGRFGPDLDDLRPSARRVRRMIRTGSIDGIMQPGLYEGRDARTVAAYVARVAGSRRAR